MFKILKYVLIGIIGLLALILILCYWNIFIMRLKGNKLPKRKVKSEFKKRHITSKIFIDLPQAYARDYYERNPDAMDIHGLYMFCGEQGTGKTIAAVHFIRMMMQKYPLVKTRSNISISFQNGKINHWSDLINVHNGEIGQIDFIDELQNWFSTNESRNFPPQMLQEITQERKKHKVIVGTSQVFTRMAKPLREQTTYLCTPRTIVGVFTIVPVFKPVLDDDGKLQKKKFVKIYCFVHDDDLRKSYNTYERVELLAQRGFIPATEINAVNQL